LFILGLEVLSRLLFREEALGNIKGLKIPRNNPAIHHLLFVDDLLIFGKATPKEASIIQSCLVKYCLWSGQSINNGKFSIRFSKNTNPSTTALILDLLPYSPQTTINPFTLACLFSLSTPKNQLLLASLTR
jgi:hypothetical protein